MNGYDKTIGFASRRLAAILLFALAPASQAQLPSGPTVVAGQATISQAASQQTVNQASDKAIIHWDSFSIGAGNRLTFVQPGSHAVALNRVTGSTPSSILGSLSANGQVFLVNPNGVFFGQGAVLDTAGLVATTLDIRNEDFLAGQYVFSRSAHSVDDAAVGNEGLLRARDGGYVVLAGERVSNSGHLEARLGTVALAAGGHMTLDVQGDQLVNFTVDEATASHLGGVSNLGQIAADGGRVILTAMAARQATGAVVNAGGTIRAAGIEERNGEILLTGGDGEVQVNGQLDVSGASAGKVQISARHIGLMAGAEIDASAQGGGGQVLIGGGAQGASLGPANAEAVYFDSAASIRSNALESGDGGQIVLWADGATRAHGSLSARGAGTGDGGFIETSGKNYLDVAGARVDTRSDAGRSGSWLLDPTDITISRDDDDTDPNFDHGIYDDVGANQSTITDSAINKNLETTNVTISTGSNGFNSGTITMVGTASISGSNSLSLTANDTILLESGAQIDLDSGNLSMTAGNGITLNSGTTIDLGSGNLYLTAGNGVTQGSGSKLIAAGLSVQGSGDFMLGQTGNLRDNQIDTLAANITGNFSFTHYDDRLAPKSLTIGTVGGLSGITLNGTGPGGAKLDVLSANQSLIVNRAVSVITNGGAANNASPASIRLTANGHLNIAADLTARGGTAGTASGAEITLQTRQGHIVQTAGTIQAFDDGPATAPANAPHQALITVRAGTNYLDNGHSIHDLFSCLTGDCGRVELRTLNATSGKGSAAIDVFAPGGLKTNGALTVTGESAPRIRLSGEVLKSDGSLVSSTDIDLGGVVTVTQSAVKDANKIPDQQPAGLLISGQNISTASELKSNGTYGISITAQNNITLGGDVTTTAEGGVSLATSAAAGEVTTTGAAIIKAKQLGLAGNVEKGIFNLRTDIDALTVLGARALTIDNGAHGGTLIANAIGRVSDETEDPNTHETYPAVNKPVSAISITTGGELQILAMNNNSHNSYDLAGNSTSDARPLQLIADRITQVPSSITLHPNTAINLRPFTANRTISVRRSAPTVEDPNVTYYYAEPFIGLLDQFNRENWLVFGGEGYTGNIYIGSQVSGNWPSSEQFSLGNMSVAFVTTGSGRVYNLFATDPNTPQYWSPDGSILPKPPLYWISGNKPDLPNPSVYCFYGQACLAAISSKEVIIKDSLKQNDDRRFMRIAGQGNGSGGQGTVAPSDVDDSDGGGGGGGDGGSGSGGGGSGSHGSPGGGGDSGTPGDSSETIVTVTTPDDPGSQNPGGGSGGESSEPHGPSDLPSDEGGNSGTDYADNTDDGDYWGGGSGGGDDDWGGSGTDYADNSDSGDYSGGGSSGGDDDWGGSGTDYADNTGGGGGDDLGSGSGGGTDYADNTGGGDDWGSGSGDSSEDWGGSGGSDYADNTGGSGDDWGSGSGSDSGDGYADGSGSGAGGDGDYLGGGSGGDGDWGSDSGGTDYADNSAGAGGSDSYADGSGSGAGGDGDYLGGGSGGDGDWGSGSGGTDYVDNSGSGSGGDSYADGSGSGAGGDGDYLGGGSGSDGDWGSGSSGTDYADNSAGAGGSGSGDGYADGSGNDSDYLGGGSANGADNTTNYADNASGSGDGNPAGGDGADSSGEGNTGTTLADGSGNDSNAENPADGEDLGADELKFVGGGSTDSQSAENIQLASADDGLTIAESPECQADRQREVRTVSTRPGGSQSIVSVRGNGVRFSKQACDSNPVRGRRR